MTHAMEFVAADEYMHTPTEDSNFNESAFYDFFTADGSFAFLVRIGNRANEGHAEVTVLGFLPDGRAFFHFERATIENNDAFDAAGLRFDVIEPLKRNRVRFSGQVHVLANADELENPKKVFTESPLEHLELDFEYEDLIPMYGVDSIAGDKAASVLSTAHYQGPTKAHGTWSWGGKSESLSGFGFRDHSWGPRQWNAPQYWRWVSGIADENNFFEGFRWKIDGENPPDFGIVSIDGRVSFFDRVDFSTTYGPAPYYPETVTMTLHTPEGPVEVTGEQIHLAPLRHRKGEHVARIARSVFRCQFAGHTTIGWSEYHDQVIDGRPIGMSEA
jgi:hypothetical protein